MNTQLVEGFGGVVAELAGQAGIDAELGGETVVDEYPNCRRRSLSHLVVTVLL